jgi:transposase
MSQNGKYESEMSDPEVELRAVRRHYTTEYKLRILDEIDHATEPGEIGAILRREGLYSQIISKWRQQRARGGLDGLQPQKRGPKANLETAEVARLKRENQRLRQKLRKAGPIMGEQTIDQTTFYRTRQSLEKRLH